MSKEVFFRNDDVRDTLDKSLLHLHEMFIEHKIPITHAVEPANLTQDVIKWLNSEKEKNPEMVTIMQHGYDHRIKNNIKKGEFGGQRSYTEQFRDIKSGKQLMENYFGKNWFPAFNFPYAPYNQAAITALNDVGYLVFNSHYHFEWKRLLFYRLGHLLGRGLIFGRHVSWNLNNYPKTSMLEISINISLIKKYFNEQTDCEFHAFSYIQKRINTYGKSLYPVGLLLHHRYHTEEQHFSLVRRIFKFLQKHKFKSVSMENIYKKTRNIDGR